MVYWWTIQVYVHDIMCGLWRTQNEWMRSCHLINRGADEVNKIHLHFWELVFLFSVHHRLETKKDVIKYEVQSSELQDSWFHCCLVLLVWMWCFASFFNFYSSVLSHLLFTPHYYNGYLCTCHQSSINLFFLDLSAPFSHSNNYFIIVITVF